MGRGGRLFSSHEIVRGDSVVAGFGRTPPGFGDEWWFPAQRIFICCSR